MADAKKCEACQTRSVDVLVHSGCPSEVRFPLCTECAIRYENYGLYPLEYFNLAARYGTENNLEDDFYDSDTGEATQSEFPVYVPNGWEFPIFDEIKFDLERVIDFAILMWTVNQDIIDALNRFEKRLILQSLDRRLSEVRGIYYRVFGVVANVLGEYAADWVRIQWQNRDQNEHLYKYAECLAKCLPADEGFNLWRNACDTIEDERELTQTVWAFHYFDSNLALDWIEANYHRIKEVSETWGHTAAQCKLDEKRMRNWLASGRPLSLMALTALTAYARMNDPRRQPFPNITHNIGSLFSLTDADLKALLIDHIEIDGSPRVRRDVAYIVQHWHFEK